MKPRYRTPARLFGLLLFLLAVSPVTAPFSTCDLVAVLCGGSGAPGASIHSKASADEPAAALGGGAVLEHLLQGGVSVAAADVRDLVRTCAHDLPLRI